jgi:di/tricarboxylate transporter
MFDFFPVGVGLAVVGVAFLAVGWRLLPRRRSARVAAEDMFRIENYTSELHLPEGSPMVGRTVAEFEAFGEGRLTVAAIIREKYRRHVPQAHWVLYAEDILVVEADAHTLQRVVAGTGLELLGSRDIGADRTPIEEYGVAEAVIAAGSPMVGCTPAQLRMRERYGVNILAVGGRSTGVRLRRVKFRVGDVIVVQGNLNALPETLQLLGCLPLAERRLDLGRPRQAVLPAAILVGTMLAVSLHLVPVAVGFLGAALLVALLRILTLEEIYHSVEWPILVLFGALIPVSEAVRTTGATDLVAGWLTGLAGHLPPVGAVALMMVAAMAVTPFLNNAATVLVMGPIGAGLAHNLSLRPDAFLMAVAIGAACDFLTPIGHQCNTLVMGPGGYRFGDYARLGLPLSLLVVLLGVPLIVFFWPLS